MSNKNPTLTKESFGWTEIENDTFFKIYGDSLPNGSFQLSKRGNNYYWFYKLSTRDKGNLKYLCKTFEGKKDGLTSFQECQKVLVKRVSEGWKQKVTRNTQMTNLIDDYVGYLEKERKNPDGRQQETLSSLVTGVTQYRRYILNQDIRLLDTQNPRKYKLHIIDYINDMKERGLSRGTRMTYLKSIRQFLHYLVDDLDGKGIIPNHPLSTDVLKTIHPPTTKDRQEQRLVRYSPKGYESMYQTCIMKVRDIWRDYIKNGLSREHTNQPMGVGTNIVYFVSLLQLGRGFRLGEILHSYRSEEGWSQRYDKKKSSSYWYKHDGEWFLFLDWKGKISRVPVGGEYTMIRSFGEDEKPHSWKGEPSGEVYGKPFYDTHIVDVCLELFRDSDYLFSSPNYRSRYMKPYSTTYYQNIFKSQMVMNGEKGEGFERFDVLSSHDLRDYFISDMIHTQNIPPEELCQITRHSLQTMLKYYKRDSEETQKGITDKIEMKIRGRRKKIDDEKV